MVFYSVVLVIMGFALSELAMVVRKPVGVPGSLE